MVKIRSKLKRNNNGKNWTRGQSSTSNPEQMKYRLKARSRYFQPNLNLASNVEANGTNSSNTLTLNAVNKHEQRMAYNAETTVNDIAGSLKSFNLRDDDGDEKTLSLTQFSSSGVGDDDDDDDDAAATNTTATTATTADTYKTFATTYSTCTNMSFKKLLTGFRASSDLHKEMLAILTALTEIIRERGGTESTTEYFILLIQQIEASTEDRDIIAGIALLSLGIKSVPTSVLRSQFSSTGQMLLNCLKHFMESNNQTTIKHIFSCLSILLRAQEYSIWSYSSNWQYIEAILSFTIHNKPKIRKAAQHAVVSIVHGSCFMVPKKNLTNNDDSNVDSHTKLCDNSTDEILYKHHPASNRITKFSLKQLAPELLMNSQTTVLHVITLLKEILSHLETFDIRTICERLLSIMTAANVLIRTNCFEVFHTLFLSRSCNLKTSDCAQLVAALHQFRPDRSDVRQTLAWLTVLKEGLINLSILDLYVCINALPIIFDICTNDLWLSNRMDIITSVSNCIKELLYECVKPACATEELANINRSSIQRILVLMENILNAPFGDVAKYVVLTFAIVFETCGEFFSNELATAVTSLSKRYDAQSNLRVQIEHTIIAAIKSMGPDVILKHIPLTNEKDDVILEHTWLLPLLREGTTGATFEFFKETILALAINCNNKWHKYAKEKKVSMSHTYELLCCQLWGLFPGFCRKPKDPKNFAFIAPTLGNALEKNPEFRAPILDGLIELLQNEDDHDLKLIIAKYSKNFLPRLSNIYIQVPNGTYEADLRKKTLEVITLYITKTPNDIQKEIFGVCKQNLIDLKIGNFDYDAMYDIAGVLVLYQSSSAINEFFNTFMAPVLKKEKSKMVSKFDLTVRKQERKTYELLYNILSSENACCKKFLRKHLKDVEDIILEKFFTDCHLCLIARLKCLKIVLENHDQLHKQHDIFFKILPYAVLNYKQFSTRKENIAEEIIKYLAEQFQKANELNNLIDYVVYGLRLDEEVINNTILVLRTILQYYGKCLTINTLEFLLNQILVFLVQKSRNQAEASVVFLITFIKVLPSPLIANHLETIMKSLSTMTKDTKRYCRIQIGYLLKKLCKHFTAEELIKFVPGNDELTHRRLKKIRKQMRRETRKKINDEKNQNDEDSDEEFMKGLEKKSITIDDILADSESDLSDMDADNNDGIDVDEVDEKSKKKLKKIKSTFIREDPEDIVDLSDIKSIGNVLTEHPNTSAATKINATTKSKDENRGFKTAEDGRLIIFDKPSRGYKKNNSDDNSDDDDDDDENSSSDDNDVGIIKKNDTKKVKLGMEDNSSSDDEVLPSVTQHRKRKAAGLDVLSVRSGKTTASRYTTGGRGIHRSLQKNADTGDARSMKSGYTAKSAHTGTEYKTKKAKGDMKKKGELDPYAYIPLTRNILNKRKRAKHAGTYKNIVKGARAGALKGVKNRISKKYKK